MNAHDRCASLQIAQLAVRRKNLTKNPIVRIATGIIGALGLATIDLCRKSSEGPIDSEAEDFG